MAMNGTITDPLNHCGTTCNLFRRWKWDLSKIITRQFQSQASYAILILNRPLTQSQEFITSLWNNALVRVTVDGGTTRWDKYINELPDNLRNNVKLPDLITGDFDSITQDVLKKYENSCKVIHTPDQDHTDYTKALMELNKYCKQQNIQLEHVITICQSSGRIDQVFGNIQTLFLAKEKYLLSPKTRLYLVTDNAVSWLLEPGDHIISIPEQCRVQKKVWCSLIPVGESCVNMTTTGLKWNLKNQTLKFGEIVSTSNTFDGSDQVTIQCTNTVLWSMKIPGIIGS